MKGLTIKDSAFPASDDKTEVENKTSASVILKRKEWKKNKHSDRNAAETDTTAA